LFISIDAKAQRISPPSSQKMRAFAYLSPYNKTACAGKFLHRLNFLQINISETKLELFGINLPVE